MTLPTRADRSSHDVNGFDDKDDVMNEFSFEDDRSSFDIRDGRASATPDRLPTEPEYAHRMESEPAHMERNPFSRPLPKPIVHKSPLTVNDTHDESISDGHTASESNDAPSMEAAPVPVPSINDEPVGDDGLRSWLSHPFTSYYLVLLPVLMAVIATTGLIIAVGLNAAIGSIILIIPILVTPIIGLAAAFHLKKGVRLRILTRIISVISMVAYSLIVIIILIGTLITGTITKSIWNDVSATSTSSQTMTQRG